MTVRGRDKAVTADDGGEVRVVLLAWVRFDRGRSGWRWMWCVLLILDLLWLSALSNYKSVNSDI